MIPQPAEFSKITFGVIQDFLTTYDRTDPLDQWLAARLRERLHGEMYRREREHFSEYVDIGGES